MTALPLSQPRPSTRRWRAAAIGGAIALTGAAITAGVLFWSGGEPTTATPTAPTLTLASRGASPAIAELQAKLAANPNDVPTMVALANLYLQRVRETGDPGLYGGAEALLTKAAAASPNDPEILASQAALALGRHEFRTALDFATRAVAIDPERARYYGLRADAEIELGRYDEAVTSLQEMVDRRPDFAAFVRIAYARELFADPEGAIESMAQAIEASTGTPENLAWAHTELARLYLHFGRHNDAERALSTALGIFPNYHVALAGQGAVAASRGEIGEASARYRDAAALVPLPAYAIALGDIATARGDATEAARQYALVTSIDQLFVAAGANTDLEIALFLADNGSNPADAVARARTAYDDRPNIHAAEALGWALHKAGNSAEAIRYAEESLALGTQDPMKLYRAGVIAQANGDAERARAYLSEALRFNPNFHVLAAPAARQALAALPANP